MKKLSAISRADLLRCLRDTPEGLQAAASVLGYRREKEPPPAPRIEPEDVRAEPGGESDVEPPPPQPEIEFPAERPRLTFLMPVEAETLETETPRQPRGNPISDAELSLNRGKPGPRLPPLAPWARLATYLRSRLGVIIPGARIDERKLIRRAGTGVPLTKLPHRPRITWASEAVILWDVTPEMAPFTRDAGWLIGHLKRERGKHGLDIRLVKGLPGRHHVARIPADVPVLALSAMGQFEKSAHKTAAWIALTRHLTFLGQPFHALNPCPRDRWDPNLASAWPSAVWDRRPRPPRQGGLRASPPSHNACDAADKLVTLLAPASRIEPPLLRTARLRLGREVDAGAEWDAWHHEECWKSPECFGFQPGTAYENRLEQRRTLTGSMADLAREIGALMAEHHENCCNVVAAEAELRACLTGTPDGAKMRKLQDLLRRVVDRLHLLAPEPGSAEGKHCGLAGWFTEMVDRLDPAMRNDADLAQVIAQGLALADTWLETPHTLLAAGIDSDVYKQTLSGAASTLPEAVDCRIERLGESWRLVTKSFPPDPKAHYLSRLSLSRRPVHLTFKGGRPHTYQLSSPRLALSLPPVPAPVPLTFESDRQRLHFAVSERPSWAEKMWQDRYGLAASFSIGSVPFVLRWIPPGRFWMGSPEDEKGRREWEGPRHEVTISRGFWLGETPVTQAQWEAVMGKNPSEFKDEHRPVEKVNWPESLQFAEKLNEEYPGLHAALPAEAQWEYACRAGTQGAFHDGSPCTKPEGKDPALDALGWFGENSDGKTQPVKQKQSNAWGLYDMHGNVWEWCRDAWDTDAYRERREGVIDPETKSDDGNAFRVLRGGAWGDRAQDCRAAYRSWYHPVGRWQFLGLRLAAGQELAGAERPSGPKRRSRG